MPGHILRAQGRCGFERELAPGFSTVSFVGYKVAYNADGSDLLTEDDASIKSMGLRAIQDPFLSDYEPEDSIEKITSEVDKQNIPQGPYACPGCKSVSLMLHYIGCWD